jgi:GT2 family glycosyltransferase
VNDVLLGYLHPNEVTASFHKSLIDLIGYDLSGPRRLHSWAMVKCGSLGIAAGRNDMVKRFLEGPCEWLFMLDADMGFEPHTLDSLLSVADPEKRPMVGGLAFAQRESVADQMNGFRCFPRPTILDMFLHDDGVERFTGRAHYPVNSLVRCGATGGAILLLHRSALETVRDRFGEAWFEQIRDPNGSMMGEDVSFFARTHELDIPLHVHTGIRTTHFKHLWLAEDDFWMSFIPPPATERVDVIVPVLHRPQNVRPLMESLRASTGLATAWFVGEEDDNEEHVEVVANGGQWISGPNAHTFAEKVNLAYRRLAMQGNPMGAPWVLLVGDDVRFRPGWLDHAQDVARRYDAKVVGTNDLANPRVVRGEHATHPLISRAYIDEHGASWDGPGVVCHDGYHHWHVDDEIVVAAKQRGVFQAAMGSQVEHLHPIAGKAEMDDVYRLGEKHAAADQELFARRFKKYVR